MLVEVPPVEVPPSADVVPAVVVPPVEVPPPVEIVVPSSEEAIGAVGASEDGNFAALEDLHQQSYEEYSAASFEQAASSPLS